jgi:hypothetical protein
MSAQSDPSLFGLFEDLILTRNGVWLSNAEPITHERTLQAFSRNLYRCQEGFEIRIGQERKTVHVEDTIYFVQSIDGLPELGFSLRLNDGRTLELDPTTLKYSPGRLTCSVPHPNEGTHEDAKFLSNAYHELLRHIETDARGFFITIDGKTILLAKA